MTKADEDDRETGTGHSKRRLLSNRSAIMSDAHVSNRSGDESLDSLVKKVQAFLLLVRAGGCPTAQGAQEWNEFYETYDRLFRLLVAQRGWSEADVADAIQDLWLMAIVELPKLEYDVDRGLLEGWLWLSGTRLLIDQERRRRSHRLASDSPQIEGFVSVDREMAPELSARVNELRQQVRDAVVTVRPTISDRDYQAFKLHWFEGRSIGSVAAALGMTEPQVWAGLSRTLKKLKSVLERRHVSEER